MAHQNQEIQYTKHFINNQFVDSKSGKTYQNYNPATGRAQAQIADGAQQDVNYAVESAKRAYAKGSQWRSMDASKRGQLLYKLADLMEQYADVLATLETMDHGKPRQYTTDDVIYAIRTIRYYAGYADKMHGRTIPSDGNNLSFTRFEPFGVVGLILSSTNPLIMFAWKFAPALAAGNTLVVKPAYQTPLSALYVASLFKQAGFPDGVVNIVCGDGQNTGRYIVQHQDVYKISFSGNVRNGRDVMENAARNYLKNVSLNLSSNNTLFVFNDFDVDRAARIAHENLYINQGQNTTAAHRIYVQEDIYDEFVKRATEYARNRKVGNPAEQSTQHGPQVDEEHFNRVLTLIETTKREGAQLQYGGKRYGNQGFFIEPTVFSNCTDTMKCAQEDLHGPVQYIFKFKNYQDMVQRANANHFALATGLLTRNYDYVMQFTEDLEYGNIWINDYQMIQPQTPVNYSKQSGFDSELGKEGMYQYLQTKTITLNSGGPQNWQHYQYQHQHQYQQQY